MRRLLPFALVVALLATLTSSAHAQTAATTPATYHGHVIDLASSWDGAVACAVLSPSDIRCYDSQTEMEHALGFDAHPRSPRTVSPFVSYCQNRTDLWLTLYESTGFTGRSVSFREAGFWQNLADFSFDNTMSSWVNNTLCTALGAQDANGGGNWLSMGASSSNSNVGSTWDNVVSSIFITT